MSKTFIWNPLFGLCGIILQEKNIYFYLVCPYLHINLVYLITRLNYSI